MNSSEDPTQKGKTNQYIQVYVRVRPTNNRERLIRSNEVIEVHGPRDVIAKQMLDSRTKKYMFDRAFGMDSQQHEVYAAVVSPMIDEVLAGYNCTVFAYGQTGTGKTYTMVGEEQPTLTSTQEDASNVGIIPRALNHLFDELRMMEVEFAMRVSYLELYNEELCDLLSTDDNAKIRIFDDVNKKGSVIIQGLEEITVRSKSDVYKLLAKGQERRKTAATLMNAQSSRSHTVFSILVHIKENGIDGEEMLKIGKLNLVDLAGSENISKAGNEKGIRTRESVNINQSLLTLGRVITALVERTPHIPYRESKLTRLLQESLGGRTKTSIIATVSPGHKDLEETLSTLEYAHRAKNIQNKPEINQRLTKKVVLKEYTEEIDRLKRDLIAAREKSGVYLASDTYNDMLYKMEMQQKELNEKIHLFKALKEELQDKTRAFDDCQRNLEEISSNLIAEQHRTRITEAELSKTKRNLRKTERHYEETKHLVSCHQKTEQALSEHAVQLIQVAEEAAVDTKFLLESIDRRKSTEEQAVSASELLLKNLSSGSSVIQHEMKQMNRKHMESVKMITTDLDDNTKSNKQFTAAVLKSMEELKSLCADSELRLQRLVVDWRKKTGETSQNNAEQFLTFLKGLEQQQQDFATSTNEKLKVMTETLERQSNEHELMRSQLREKITQQNTEIEMFCNDQKSKISQHCQEVSELMARMQSKEDARKVKILEMKRLAAELENLTEEYEPLQKQCSDINDALLETESSKIQSFCDKNSMVVAEKMKCLKSVEEAQVEICEKLSKELAAIDQAVNDNKKSVDLNLKKNMEFVSSKEVELMGQLNSIQEVVESELKKTSQEHEKKGEVAVNMIKQENSRMAVKAQEVRSVVQQSLGGLVHEAETSVCEKLTKFSTEIEQFQQQDVLKYKSTGETPARKDYRFNKNIVATSPHDRIIKRLRMERALNDSQLDSSILETEEPAPTETPEALIVYSTPLRKLDNTSNESNDSDKMKGFKDLEISKVSVEEKENQGNAILLEEA